MGWGIRKAGHAEVVGSRPQTRPDIECLTLKKDSDSMPHAQDAAVEVGHRKHFEVESLRIAVHRTSRRTIPRGCSYENKP
jgi:hypothetical protein